MLEAYLEEAREVGLQIRYVFETHMHADFVSGHRELAERTVAQIVVGHRAGATFPHIAVHEGDRVDTGALRIDILETRGHSPDGISLLMTDTAIPGEPVRLFTGDTLVAPERGGDEIDDVRTHVAGDETFDDIGIDVAERRGSPHAEVSAARCTAATKTPCATIRSGAATTPTTYPYDYDRGGLPMG